MPTKVCSKCREVKSTDNFHKQRGGKDGLKAQCKACVANASADWVAKNREQRSETQRRWRMANKERVSDYNKAYLADYRLTNPNKWWESYYRERSLKAGFLPVVVSFTREDLIERHGSVCVHCGGPFEELDHYPVPVSQGGSHDLDNCVPSCATCNRQTWAKGSI